MHVTPSPWSDRWTWPHTCTQLHRPVIRGRTFHHHRHQRNLRTISASVVLPSMTVSRRQQQQPQPPPPPPPVRSLIQSLVIRLSRSPTKVLPGKIITKVEGPLHLFNPTECHRFRDSCLLFFSCKFCLSQQIGLWPVCTRLLWTRPFCVALPFVNSSFCDFRKSPFYANWPLFIVECFLLRTFAEAGWRTKWRRHCSAKISTELCWWIEKLLCRI